MSALFVLLLAGGAWAAILYRLGDWDSSADRDAADLFAVERGDVVISVVESGALESANKATVKCRVEAVLGMVGGANGVGGMGSMGGGGGRGGSVGGGSGGGRGGSAGAGGTSAVGAVGVSAGKAATGKSAGSAASKGGMSGAGSAGGRGSSGAGGGGGGGGGAGGGGMGGGGGGEGGNLAAGAATLASSKPVIRSFTYMVTPHMPLRGAMAATAARGVSSITQLGGMGGGQGGQGGRGGGRGGNNFEERAGATRILRILPEGSVVAKDDIVCWLDAASFEDALRQQNITHAEAKSWVEQAKVSLEVAQMELEEYKKGIYPQDFEQLTKYVIICETQCQQNRRNTAWEREMLARNLRGPSQLRASELSLEQAETALREAKTMLNTLKSYTGPKVIKNLEAKIESVRSDYLAQESSFKLEDERKRKLEATIANCILRAPRDGIVVYESQANSWGRVEDLIQEGATVREDQPIFSIPDPTRMRVRAKINESKVMLVETGVPTQVRIDAFPDEEFTGSVAGVTPIPAPAAGPISDIKIYVAMIDFDTEGFNRLRTGMTAEVSFIKEQKRGVLRIPVTAIRFLNGAPFVAQRDARSKAVTWKPIQIGLANRAHAEVTGGLKEGERIVTDATRLVPPSPPGRSESSPGEPPPNPGAISALLPVRK